MADGVVAVSPSQHGDHVSDTRASTPSADSPRLTPEIQVRLGKELSKLYMSFGDAPLPQRFLDLIARLEELERDQPRAVEPALRDEMLGALPSLRAFAISLTNNVDAADDLVQETILKAWKNIDRFERGTNLNAWLFTILRNQFHTVWRKQRREVEDPDEAHAGKLRSIPAQPGHLALIEMREALEKLPPDQREALLLVGAEGLSYEEAAQICEVAVGTIKSRVNRARKRLAELLSIEDEEDFGPDRVTRAALLVE